MSIFLVALLGGIFVSDATAAGQLMISRPIFCAPLIGWVMGDINTGLLVGVLMELIWINVVPLGNAVPPDSTVVAVASAYISSLFPAASGEARYGFIVFSILCFIPMGIIFKKLDIIHREYNAFLSGEIEDRLREGEFSAVDIGIYKSWLFFVIKGAVFLFLIMLAAEAFMGELYGTLGEKAQAGLSNAFYILPAVGLGAAINSFIFKKSKRI